MKVKSIHEKIVQPPIERVEISLSYDEAVCLARLCGRVSVYTQVGEVASRLWSSLKRCGVTYDLSYSPQQNETIKIIIKDEGKRK